MRDALGWESGPLDAITDVPGIRVGHWTDRRGATGCTVVLCETCTVAAVDVRGGAPGTRETDALGLTSVARRCHAVLLGGGSAFGLAAATGVAGVLRERGVGFETRHGPVPVVPAAILFDLGVGSAAAFPQAEHGRLAALRAKRGKVAQGCAGAGTGATVAKLLGTARLLKGGLGSASVTARGLTVGAIVATNALGHIVDPDTGTIVAGPRASEPGSFTGIAETVALTRPEETPEPALATNTTLLCVATDAAVEHAQAQRLAVHAHDGLARTIVPVHALGDGDVAFVIGMGRRELAPGDLLALGAMVARAVERAVLKSVRLATSSHGIPSAAEWSARAR